MILDPRQDVGLTHARGGTQVPVPPSEVDTGLPMCAMSGWRERRVMEAHPRARRDLPRTLALGVGRGLTHARGKARGERTPRFDLEGSASHGGPLLRQGVQELTRGRRARRRVVDHDGRKDSRQASESPGDGSTRPRWAHPCTGPRTPRRSMSGSIGSPREFSVRSNATTPTSRGARTGDRFATRDSTRRAHPTKCVVAEAGTPVNGRFGDPNPSG